MYNEDTICLDKNKPPEVASNESINTNDRKDEHYIAPSLIQSQQPPAIFTPQHCLLNNSVDMIASIDESDVEGDWTVIGGISVKQEIPRWKNPNKY